VVYIFPWLNARYSIYLMLIGVRALRHCMDDHLPAISQTAWHCKSCKSVYLKVSFHYSVVCPLSRNILHKLVAP